MDSTKLHAARLTAERAIYEIMDKLEGKSGKGIEGFNAKEYKLYFDSLSDKEFFTFMSRLANEEWFNLRFQVDLMDKKDTPSIERMKKEPWNYAY